MNLRRNFIVPFVLLAVLVANALWVTPACAATGVTLSRFEINELVYHLTLYAQSKGA